MRVRRQDGALLSLEDSPSLFGGYEVAEIAPGPERDIDSERCRPRRFAQRLLAFLGDEDGECGETRYSVRATGSALLSRGPRGSR